MNIFESFHVDEKIYEIKKIIESRYVTEIFKKYNKRFDLSFYGK